MLDTKLKKALCTLKNGVNTLDAVAKKLDINKTTLEAMTDFLEYEGYLKGVDCSCRCTLCSKGCGTSVPTKMYLITKKGEEYLTL